MKSAKYIGAFTAAAHILLTGCSNNIEGAYASSPDSEFRLEISNKKAKISSFNRSIEYKVTSEGAGGFTLSPLDKTNKVLGFNYQGPTNTWICIDCSNDTLPNTWMKK